MNFFHRFDVYHLSKLCYISNEIHEKSLMKLTIVSSRERNIFFLPPFKKNY